MTLGELIELACIKCHRTDDETRAEVRNYITARYQMLWDSRPWRDALAILTLPVEMVSRITILPGVVDRVQAVRWGDGDTLEPRDYGVAFSVDPASFERAGTPANYSLIAPSGVEIAPGGGKIKVNSSDANATGTVSILGMDGIYERSETLSLAGTGLINSVYDYDEVHSLSKSTTTYDITAKKSDDTQILFLTAAESGRRFQRIQFQSEPDEDKALLILFKRRCRPLKNDADATELSGVDNALLAAAISDVMEGQRQYAKAQIKAQEATALAQAMADLERHQSASGISLVPYDAAMAPDDEWRCN